MSEERLVDCSPSIVDFMADCGEPARCRAYVKTEVVPMTDGSHQRRVLPGTYCTCARPASKKRIAPDDLCQVLVVQK